MTWTYVYGFTTNLLNFIIPITDGTLWKKMFHKSIIFFFVHTVETKKIIEKKIKIEKQNIFYHLLWENPTIEERNNNNNNNNTVTLIRLNLTYRLPLFEQFLYS